MPVRYYVTLQCEYEQCKRHHIFKLRRIFRLTKLSSNARKSLSSLSSLSSNSFSSDDESSSGAQRDVESWGSESRFNDSIFLTIQAMFWVVESPIESPTWIGTESSCLTATNVGTVGNLDIKRRIAGKRRRAKKRIRIKRKVRRVECRGGIYCLPSRRRTS